MIACVLINTSVKKLNKVYDYLVKEEDISKIQIGKRVKVNFGRGKNSYAEGIIVKIRETEYVPKYKLKEIEEILDEVSYIDDTKLKLAKWMAYMYFCNVYDVLKLMLPPGTNSIDNSKILKSKQEIIIKLNKSIDVIEKDIENKVIKTAKQILLLRFLKEIDKNYVALKDIENGLNIGKSVINKLKDAGYIVLEKKDIEDEYVIDENIKRDEKRIPTEEQLNAINKINNYIERREHKKILLFGVTGSR